MGDFTGKTVYFDDSLRFIKKPSEAFIPDREYLDDYLVYEKQSIYDLAVQLYGDMNEGLGEVVKNTNQLNYFGSIPQGTLLKRKNPTSNIAEIFNDENIIVSTTPAPTIGTGEGGLEEGLEFALIG